MLTVLTGRSRRLWPRVLAEIGAARSCGAERLLLMTPDQYTLTAELELIDHLRLPGLLGLEVLSPARLRTRVFAQCGSPARVRVDARGKAMMLSEALRVSRGELAHYGGAALRRGFAQKLSGCIGDFKRAGLTPDDVREKAEGLDPQDALRAKLLDLSLLYARYEARLAGAFLDEEDAQEALLERLPDSDLLPGAQIWVYGFDLISPQFARQIAVMARGASSVRLALTLEDASARDGAAFAPARDTLARLARRFDREGLLWAREHIAEALLAPPEIQHLERELFAMPLRPFPGEVGAVTLLAAANPYDEAMRVAAALCAYARAGLPFGAMSVVVGDMDAYQGAVESAFARSGIPFHLARKRPALSHPLLRAWLAALRCVTQGWRAEDALDWLKGGFSGLTQDEGERLENYAIEHGLRGTKWRKPAPDATTDGLRARFVAPLETLQARLRDAADSTQTLGAVYGLLEDVQAYDALLAWEDALLAHGLDEAAADCAQAWRIALETLDQLHVLLGGERLPMAGVARALETGLAAAELGAVPPRPGIVQVGALGHVKLGSDCRVLFLLGMQDGILTPAAPSMLSDAEVRRLASSDDGDAAFGLRGDALSELMQVNLLDTLAAPTERLFISYALCGTGGEAQRPAAIIGLLRRLFPQLRERGGAAQAGAIFHAPGVALDALGPMLREGARRGGLSEREAETAAWLLTHEETRERADKVLRTLRIPPAAPPLTRPLAGSLYARTRTSVSRLESFANCPYRHFVAYGLRPRPRRDYAVARDETGTFYHRAMEEFTRAAAADPAWPGLTRPQSDALMDAALAPLKAEWENAPLSENAMLRATGEVFCRIARRTAWTYTDQMRRSAFRTGAFEARFGPGEALPPIPLALADGQTVWLEGRIDRIDFFESEGESWLCVVDYKSGGTSLEPARLYGGLQLQLMLYLRAMVSRS